MERIKFTILRGSSLISCDFNGKSDPYVKFVWRKQTYKTSVRKKTLNPEWNETFLLDYEKTVDNPIIILEVFDWDTFGKHDGMGVVYVELFSCSEYSVEKSYPVQINNKKSGGELYIRLQRITLPATGFSQIALQNMEPIIPVTNVMQQISPCIVNGNGPTTDQNGDGQRHGIAGTALVANIPPTYHTTHANGFLSYQRGETQIPQTILPFPTPMILSAQNTQYSKAYGRKKALLIGINYIGQNSQLSGCIADVHRMRQLLTQTFGFPNIPEAIVCLTDDSRDPRFLPTKSNILYAMNWLVQGVAPGDSLFFQYSGHGSQVPNQDGTEADGKDEVICPVDCHITGFIKDDVIHRILCEPLPNGARLTAVMDCCHSGTGFDLPYLWDPRSHRWNKDVSPILTQGDVQLFSGCTDAQVSMDMPGAVWNNTSAGGAMTLAFIAAISKNPFGYTFSALLEQIKIEIRRLSQSGENTQLPLLSASQPFRTDRLFNFTDVCANLNPILGRYK